MRRHVIAAVAASIMLAGCGSSVDGSATAAPSTSAAGSSGAPSSSASPGASGGSADARPEVLAWAAGFCTAAQPVVDAISSASDSASASAGPLTPEQAKASTVNLLTTFATAFTTAASGISALGPPPVDGADAFATGAVTAFDGAGQTLDDLAKQASAVDFTDDAARKAFGNRTNTLGDTLSSAFKAIDSNPPAELQAALSSLPECAAFNK